MTDPPVPHRRRLPMTDERKERFLQALRENGGLLRASAQAASPHCTGPDGGLTSFRRAMAQDPDFEAAVREAEEAGIAAMEEEFVGLIRHGWIETDTVDAQGRRTTRLKRSERLMELWLKAKCPEYREASRISVDAKVERAVQLRLDELSDEELEQLETAVGVLQAAQARDQ